VAKFVVKVTITAKISYEVEVDETTEPLAEQAAISLWKDEVPLDFRVNEGYVTAWDTETDQLTAECPRCFTEHTIPSDNLSHAASDSWHEDFEYCAACGAKIEAEEKANG
jgi:hypothetical protein